MPELPDITLYIEALQKRLVDRVLLSIRLASPFVVRSVAPPVSALTGRIVRSIRRLGKQIVFAFDEDLFLVLHLMIAGRLQWKQARSPIPGKVGLAALDFENGTLLLTEAGSKKRASLHVVAGESELRQFDRGALEVLGATLEDFRSVLLSENHTVKRALTDPRLFSGIGNAYSDEILHEARLSPLKLTSKLTGDEVYRLLNAVQTTLTRWVDLLRQQTGSDFPSKVTAFRPEMAVHGRYGKPCPRCGSPVQRISYAENECNYCAVCQTDGKLLADRAMSRLLKDDWPRSLDELEKHFEKRKVPQR
jgi:formamidopyrimidine-DNA glycosylase